MRKAEAATLKPGDKVRFKKSPFEYTVRSIAPYVNGLWTTKDFKEIKGGKWDGYCVYLNGVQNPVDHKKLERV